MAVRCITTTRLRPAVLFASASGMVTAGASAASRSATDLNRQALNPPNPDLETRLRPGFSFSARRPDRAQHRLARPAIHLEPCRLLVGPERRACLHPRLAIYLVGIETDARQVTLHGLDIGGAQLGRSRPRRRERLGSYHAVAEVPDE